MAEYRLLQPIDFGDEILHPPAVVDESKFTPEAIKVHVARGNIKKVSKRKKKEE